jgi:hypothetical protein
MWVNANPAPGEGFSEAAFGVSFYGYVADVANNIIINVSNVDPATQTFVGFVRGGNKRFSLLLAETAFLQKRNDFVITSLDSLASVYAVT